MRVTISTERVFSMSCFEGLRLLRKYKDIQPNISIDELISLIEKVEADGGSLDLAASVHLDSLIDEKCVLEGMQFYQICIKAILLKHQPIWSKAMRSGRKRFVQALSRNDQDIFAAAGLMATPPSNDIITWWDDVSGHARLILDQSKMKQGRAAEVLTLEYERKRLEKLGITKEPKWPGLDDNYAGYDVLSYDLGEYGLINRMIEVKSTSASPLRFFVTRNEWKKAEKAMSSYYFHIWDMTKNQPVLYIRTVEEIFNHIPTDNEKGIWTIAEIPLTN